MAETVPCPECGSTQIEPVGGLFTDNHCADCDRLFCADFVELDWAKAEFREAVVAAVRSDLQRIRHYIRK